MRVTRAQCEPAFICEENWVPMADLPVLVFYDEWASSLHSAGT